MVENASYSLADIGALMNGRNGYGDGFGGGAWWIIILFFAMFWGGNGWGNNRNGQGFDNMLTSEFGQSRILGKLDGITNGLCDGFYAQNTTMLQGQGTLSREIMENRFAAKECCCETNRNIDAVRYENAKNTCDIVRAIEKDGDATRALINSNTMQALRDKIAEQGQMLQTANFQLSQQAQSANIISTLQPTPKPAYLTCSPYQASQYAYQGFGGGCGCGGYGF